MKRKILLIILLSTFLSSCTKEEKRFISLVENIKKSKIEVLGVNDFPVLNTDLLAQLKEYSELVTDGSELFESLLTKGKTRKRVRKYLIQNIDLSLICTNLLIEDDLYQDIKDQCTEGFFDICPISFSRYKKNLQEIIKNLNDLLGDQAFSQTDCNNYMSEEL